MAIFRERGMIFSCQVLGGLSEISPDVKEGIRGRGGIRKNSMKTASISLLIFSRGICK